jgi:hypothetical protein
MMMGRSYAGVAVIDKCLWQRLQGNFTIEASLSGMEDMDTDVEDEAGGN